MTPNEWMSLPREQRRQAWGRMTPEERLALYQQLAATTPIFSLPYPEDYNDPADSPLVMRELAIATDNALALVLAGAAPRDHSHSEYSPVGHLHDDRYSLVGHKHGAIEVRSVNLGTIGPDDQEKTSGPQPKAASQNVIAAIVVAPSSTYLLPVIYLDSDTSWRVKVRNETETTTHTNVTVYVTLARQGV